MLLLQLYDHVPSFALVVLKPAPEFKGTAVVNGEFKSIKLSDYKGKYLILVFYPLDFTFVCPTEIIAYSDRIAEFRALNTELVFVSVDSEYAHLAWTEQPRKQGGLGPISAPILSDATKCISATYGVLLEEDGHSTRANFIIDPQGIVRHITINEPGVGRSVDETLRVLNAVQFHAKHGDVCPANWTPGSDTIKPEPKKSKEFFSKHA